MLKRLQGDHQLAIITLFGVCASVAVLPFTFYRWLTHAYAVAALDAAIALGIFAVVVYAWRTGRTRGPGFLMTAINNTGVMLSVLLHGNAGLPWLYSVLIANYFLMPRRIAATVSVLEVAALAVHGDAFASTSYMASFVMSSLLTSMLAFILAHWTDHQRHRLELLATHDTLTGLGNRRAMEQDMQRAMQVVERNRTPCGVAIIDIDHFKLVNDRHGHAAGDAVLAAFADLLCRSVRKVDGVYRYGGEEFLLLLPDADVAGLETVTETLRFNIEHSLQGPDKNLTVSLGAAALEPGESAQTWLSRADRALYLAKGVGRNRACVDGADTDKTATLTAPKQTCALLSVP